jgi:hypothetical protein
MIILSAQTDNLQVVLGGNVTSNQLHCFAAWRDRTDNTFIAGRTVSVTNNTTDVNIVSAPGASTQRLIDYLSVYNADTVASTITIKLDANGVEYILFKGLLAIGERLEYTDKNGFQTFTIAGAIKTAQVQGTNNAVISTMTTVVSTQNTVNNNASANTLADVTGLAFAVTSGESYYFEAVIMYTAAATSTGSRWTINGPANPTYLYYNSEYSLAATTQTINYASAYQIPAASNATSLAAGNTAWITGIIKASSNGILQVQFASEISGSAITALTGSFIRYQRLT